MKNVGNEIRVSMMIDISKAANDLLLMYFLDHLYNGLKINAKIIAMSNGVMNGFNTRKLRYNTTIKRITNRYLT